MMRINDRYILRGARLYSLNCFSLHSEKRSRHGSSPDSCLVLFLRARRLFRRRTSPDEAHDNTEVVPTLLAKDST